MILRYLASVGFALAGGTFLVFYAVAVGKSALQDGARSTFDFVTTMVILTAVVLLAVALPMEV